MTGAACLWCTVAVFFGIAATVILIFFGFEVISTVDIDWKNVLGGLFISLLISGFVMISAYQCQKCYDVNFAVAMKNINYTTVREVNTNIEMNYQDITKENK